MGEPFPVTASVFREGHDRLGAEVVPTDPKGKKHPPIAMVKNAHVPDRYAAWVTPDQPGLWSFEVQSWSDPIGTWQHAAGLKIPAGVDVDLMFTEGRLLFERVLKALPRGTRRARTPTCSRPPSRRRRTSPGRSRPSSPRSRRPS